MKEKLNKRQRSLPWHVVERAIQQELEWLENIFLSSEIQYHHCDLCARYALRLMAIEIIQGRIFAKEYRAEENPIDLWGGLTIRVEIKPHEYHGGKWHRKMIGVLREYFELDGFDVEVEPLLHFGRADLGVFGQGKLDLYIEIGFTNPHKFWRNISVMRGCMFLVVPDEKKVFEFKRIKWNTLLKD